MRTLAGGALDSAVFKELQLSLKPFEDKKKSLKMGLITARDIAAAAFLASTSQTNKLCERCLPPALADLAT